MRIQPHSPRLQTGHKFARGLLGYWVAGRHTISGDRVYDLGPYHHDLTVTSDVASLTPFTNKFGRGVKFTQASTDLFAGDARTWDNAKITVMFIGAQAYQDDTLISIFDGVAGTSSWFLKTSSSGGGQTEAQVYCSDRDGFTNYIGGGNDGPHVWFFTYDFSSVTPFNGVISLYEDGFLKTFGGIGRGALNTSSAEFRIGSNSLFQLSKIDFNAAAIWDYPFTESAVAEMSAAPFELVTPSRQVFAFAPPVASVADYRYPVRGVI